MDKKVLGVIIMVVVLVSFGLYLSGFYFGPKAFQYKQKNSTEIKEVNKTEIAPTEVPLITIPPENNFSKSGNFVNKDGASYLLYDEPGKLALTVVLKFTKNSICDLGKVDTYCNLPKLEEGLFVTITGQQTGDIVEVYKLEKQEIN